ncbi:uncharacterized protein LOC121367391 [Gigantopelta aegis]|uniref:uncharacterized protein LOC121367391 n=1 Tax=Gigantopelta aegis TaxID=1735272 RepID=UPI001B889CC0|nr:uncharacterized protein LOC121367391 [Gigantopelta aegis]XP_041347478.1 uncharacterized protein LOC121367391 [Gigantopelta aegis]
MGDRASNEKASNVILDKWRIEVLTACNSSAAVKTLHLFHCMAHVLLGFHTYTHKSILAYEKELEIKLGRFGRDALPRFSYWKKEEAASRTSRTTADTFGPAGDHIGVRDLWECYCASKGIKSQIGNYRDNRFNCYFETAAQICLHREDFINVLKKVKKPNGKLVSVLADLTCPVVTTILQARGLLFVLVTGPYWELMLVNDGTVKYLELFRYIQPLHHFMKECSDDPSPLLQGISPLPKELLHASDAMYNSVSLLAHATMEDVFLNTLKKSSAAFVQTSEAQLKDFLVDGKYGQAPDTVELNRTCFSGITNLACEHHFGDLDSSQRRRPSATLFFHSTIQLLKRNRKQLISWMSEMSEQGRETLWSDAREKAKALRREKEEMEKILKNLQEEPKSEPKEGRKRKVTDAAASRKKRGKPAAVNSDSSEEDLTSEVVKLILMKMSHQV